MPCREGGTVLKWYTGECLNAVREWQSLEALKLRGTAVCSLVTKGTKGMGFRVHLVGGRGGPRYTSLTGEGRVRQAELSPRFTVRRHEGGGGFHLMVLCKSPLLF